MRCATQADFDRMQDERREAMLRELGRELCEMVRQGAITDMQANEIYNDKADQWAAGLP